MSKGVRRSRMPALLLSCMGLALTAIPLAAAHAQTAPAPAACPADGPIAYLCGARNVEDMEQIPGRPILVGASYGLPPGSPSLILIDTEHRTVASLPMEFPAKPEPPYGACPGPLSAAVLSPHGLALRIGADGRHQLYVVNHGGRESIEVFALDARTSDIRARWLGCVVLPEGASGNAVAPLDDGGFVATKFYDTREGTQRAQFLAGKRTSLIYRWSSGKGLSIIPGGEMIGDNGMLVSKDGGSLYVTSWIEKRIIRLPLQGGTPSASTSVDFMPDNLRWAPDGSILAAGQATDIKLIAACKHARCPADWAVARLDPQTMAVSYLFWEKGTAAFGGATTAVQMGGKLWMGTFSGDRLAIADPPAKPLP